MFRTLCFSALLAAALAGQVHAADPGECGAPEAMTAKLKAEDQHSIITAIRIGEGRKLVGMIVTMSSDRSVGYILDSDRALGVRATALCILVRLKDIRLFDARKPGLAPGVLLNASDADGERQCDAWARAGTVSRGSCGALNAAIRKTEPKGERVLLHGLVVEKGSSGAYEPRGVLATLTGEMGGSLADVDNLKGGTLTYSALPSGGSFINRTFVVPEFTPYGAQAVEKR